MSKYLSQPLRIENSYLEIANPSGRTPGLAPSGRTRLFYDPSSNSLQVSSNGGPFASVGSGAGSQSSLSLTADAAATTALTVTAHASQSADLVAISGTPPASATKAMVRLGAAIAGGSANGTWLGINADTAFTGDLLRLQINGSDLFQLTYEGRIAMGAQPVASGVRSLLGLGNAIASGNANGTYLGINAPSGYTGDLVHYQVNGTSFYKIDANGFAGLGATTLTYRFDLLGSGNNITSGGLRAKNSNNGTSAGGAVVVESASSSGQLVAYPSGFTGTSAFADSLVLSTGSDASHLILAAPSGSQEIRFRVPTTGQIFSMATGVMTIANGVNLVAGTTTGTKIGVTGGSSGEKWGFFGAAPIVQPLLATGASATVDNVITVLQNLGLCRQS